MCSTKDFIDKQPEQEQPPQASKNDKTMRVVFPNTHARADHHTLYVWFRRHALLFVLYFLWICMLSFFACMWLATFATIARTVATLGKMPLPFVIQVYVVCMALYYSFHHLAYSKSSPQSAWPALRAFCRRSVLDYSYFRHHICIFEEKEQECLENPEKPMVAPNDKAMFAYHPHGVLSSGWALNGTHSMRFQQSDAKWLIADNLFWFPVLRDVLHWLAYDDVSKQTFLKHMQQDRNICLMPGGFEEATIYRRGKHRVFIKKRAGFIKLALQHGYKVHPVYTFGEEQTYHTMHYFLKQRMLLNKWKVPGVVFCGRLLCFFMPHDDIEITTVVGKAIQLPMIPNPSKEDVAKYHNMYMDALVQVFERNKHKYAVDPSLKLEMY